jgi:hypothetical protein
MGDEQLGSLIYPPLGAAAPNSAEQTRLGLKINGHVSSPLVFTGIFSAQECQRIMGLSGHRRQRAGTMMYARPNIRKSTIAWIDVREDSQWLYEKVWNTFQAVKRWFQFDLFGLVDEIQFARYGVGDGFGWHLDTGGGQTSTRKLSMSVQLCNCAMVMSMSAGTWNCAPVRSSIRVAAAGRLSCFRLSWLIK